ncbi:MAG: VOC family protein [Clostridiales bacterium]|nr:VOC family protein [Clostridiales bacterium]
MRVFDHIGMTTTQKMPNERYVQRTKVWVTDPQLHPFKIEWLRYEEDSTVPDILRNSCHVAWHVDDIAAESKGLKVILAPFSSVAGHVVGFFQTEDGAIVELMEY